MVPVMSSSINIPDRPVGIDETHIGPDDCHPVIDTFQHAQENRLDQDVSVRCSLAHRVHLTFFDGFSLVSQNRRQNVQTRLAIVERLDELVDRITQLSGGTEPVGRVITLEHVLLGQVPQSALDIPSLTAKQ